MSKRLVESCHAIKISDLLPDSGWKREFDADGLVVGGGLATLGLGLGMDANRGPQTSVTVSYALEGGPRETDRLLIEATKPNYGGRRYWLVCHNCLRRVRKLFRPPDEDVFACRRCHDLAYGSQRERSFVRGLRRIRKVRRKLGGGPNLTEAFPQKPKRMRWLTWRRLMLNDDLKLRRTLFYGANQLVESKERRLARQKARETGRVRLRRRV